MRRVKTKMPCPNPNHIYKRLVKAFKDDDLALKERARGHLHVPDYTNKVPTYPQWMTKLADTYGGKRDKLKTFLTNVESEFPKPISSRHIRVLSKAVKKVIDDLTDEGMSTEDAINTVKSIWATNIVGKVTDGSSSRSTVSASSYATAEDYLRKKPMSISRSASDVSEMTSGSAYRQSRVWS